MQRKIGIMQPYLFPYLGYFQLISAVDAFVLSDDLQYINQGWINRNKILVNGEEKLVQFPLKKASHLAKINERELAGTFPREREKFLKTVSHAYGRAPFFKKVFPLLERIAHFPEVNLAKYAENSLRSLCRYLVIATPILISSELNIDPRLNAQERVMATVKKLDGNIYINPIGGLDLYHFGTFSRNGISLQFHRMDEVRYRQFGNEFKPYLSIIDVLMFNSVTETRQLLSRYSLHTQADTTDESGAAFHVANA